MTTPSDDCKPDHTEKISPEADRAITAALPRILRWFTKSLGIRADAEDLQQQVCLAVIERLRDPNQKPVENVRGFLFIAARHGLYDCTEQRKKQAALLAPEVAAESGSDRDNPEHLLQDEQVLRAVQANLSRAHEGIQKAFELRALGWSDEEISAQTGIPVSQVKEYLRAGRKRLEPLRKRLGLTLPRRGTQSAAPPPPAQPCKQLLPATQENEVWTTKTGEQSSSESH